MKIIANMIVGAKPEPYLKACIESIYPCIDEIVIVANEHNANSDIMEQYNKVRVLYRPFENFAKARNTALENSKEPGYILWVDADEVHFTDKLAEFIKLVVTNDADGGNAAFYHFVKDFKHYQSIDLRMILIRNKMFYWENPVDEYPIFLSDKKVKVINTKYLYHHYGYTKPQRELWNGWMERADILGSKDEWFATKDPDTILDERKLIEYKGEYPLQMKGII